MADPDHCLLARILRLDAGQWQSLAAQLGSPLALTRLSPVELAACGLSPAAIRSASRQSRSAQLAGWLDVVAGGSSLVQSRA